MRFSIKTRILLLVMTAIVQIHQIHADCIIDGHQYGNFQPVPSNDPDPCIFCVCDGSSGSMLCGSKQCAGPREGYCKITPPTDQCCGDYVPCESLTTYWASNEGDATSQDPTIMTPENGTPAEETPASVGGGRTIPPSPTTEASPERSNSNPEGPVENVEDDEGADNSSDSETSNNSENESGFREPLIRVETVNSEVRDNNAINNRQNSIFERILDRNAGSQNGGDDVTAGKSYTQNVTRAYEQRYLMKKAFYQSARDRWYNEIRNRNLGSGLPSYRASPQLSSRGVRNNSFYTRRRQRQRFEEP